LNISNGVGRSPAPEACNGRPSSRAAWALMDGAGG
jgi:hypothetical protein